MKQPWNFHRHNDALMVFAGLWETWKPPDAVEPLNTFTIVTADPNLFAADFDKEPAKFLKKINDATAKK